MSTAPIDGYGAFVRAGIRAKDGAYYPLWLDPGQGAGHWDRPFLQEVTVKLNLGDIPVIAARLSPTYHDAIRFLDSTLVEWANDGTLEVQMGYSRSGGFYVQSPLYSGLLLKPDVNLGPDIAITLNAQGIPLINHASTGGTVTWTARPRLEIMREVLAGPSPDHPLPMRIDTEEVDALGPGSQTYRVLYQEPITVAQSGRTDWQLLTDLARECRCWMVLVEDRVVLLPREIVARRGPTRTFRYFNHPPGGYTTGREYPLYSASSPSLGVYLSDETLRAYRQTDVTRERREVRSRLIGDAEAQPARMGANAQTREPSVLSPGIRRDGRRGAVSVVGDPTDPRALVQLGAEYDFATTRAGVKIQGETMFLPDLMPGEIVFVTGLGRRLVSETGYIVMEATHTASSGGYTTAMELVSNTANVLAEAQRAYGPTAQASPAAAQAPAGAGAPGSATAVSRTAVPMRGVRGGA